jgi:hypothetical protein
MSNIKVWYKLDGGAGFVFLEPGSTVEGLRHAVKIAKEATLHGVGHDDLIVYDPSGAPTAPFTLMKDDPQHLTIYVVKIPPRATLEQRNCKLCCCFCIQSCYNSFLYSSVVRIRNL